MQSLLIRRISLLCGMALSFIACSDDSSVNEALPDLMDFSELTIPDSILQSDSLYTWYMEQLGKKSVSISGNAISSSSNAKDDPEIGEKEPEKEGVVLLPPAGFYSELTIPVPLPQQNGKIYCSYDGSEPNPKDSASLEFTEPLSIEKNTVVRCAEFVNDSAVRKSTQTYFIGETVAMPVVAISVDPYDMFDSQNGYYSQGVTYCSEPCYEANYWRDIELPVHVEFFENGSTSIKKAWEIDAGLSIVGQWSRYRAKKSVSITMRKIYEDGRLKYPLFKTRPENKKFKAFNLRNNGNRFVGDYIEDPMASSLLEGSGLDYQRSRQVVVFYNGEYYGIHDLRERLNEHYIETNYGIDSKVVDVVKHLGTEITASGGTTEGYLDLLQRIYTYDFSKNDTAYDEIKTLMDVGNYADYMAAEIYYQNGDWPNNNVRAWRGPDQPWKFMVFDLDHGFGWDWSVYGFSDVQLGYETMFDWVRHGGRLGGEGTNYCANTLSAQCFHTIYVRLSENSNFRRLFVNHGAVMLSHYLTYDKVVAATDAMMETIPLAEQKRDLNRFMRDHSFDATGATLKSFASTRTATTRDEYRKEFGLGPDISVTISASGNGSVLLDGMKLPSTNYTGTFFGGNDMLLQAVPKAGSVFNGWSDGNPDNPRLVSPTDGSKYTATFK